MADNDNNKKDNSTKKMLMGFPVAIVCLIIFLILGFCFNLWHPGWIIFLLIPIYFWIVKFVFRDK